MRNEFHFTTDDGAEEEFSEHVKNMYLPLLLIVMAVIVFMFLNGPVYLAV